MTLLMENTLKEMRDGWAAVEVEPNSTIGGGVEDVYGEDQATEDQPVTPWTVSVARYSNRINVRCFLLIFWVCIDLGCFFTQFEDIVNGFFS